MIYLSNLYVSYMRDFELLAIYKKTVEREEKHVGRIMFVKTRKKRERLCMCQGRVIDEKERERERYQMGKKWDS